MCRWRFGLTGTGTTGSDQKEASLAEGVPGDAPAEAIESARAGGRKSIADFGEAGVCVIPVSYTHL